MEKTIDQIREEVIAECKCLCPKSNDIHWLDNVGRNYLFRESDDVWMLNCVDNVFSIIAHDDNPSIWLYTYRLLGLESRAKDAEIARLQSQVQALESQSMQVMEEDYRRLQHEVERLRAVAAVWNPVSAMAAITESLKLANQEAEIGRLRGMLEAVVSHAKEPAMRDWQFRQFAIENCEYTLKGGEDD